MNKEIDFEIYLIISYGNFEIFLFDIKIIKVYTRKNLNLEMFQKN